MADTTPLIRQWKILHILSARQRGATIRDLADEMDVVDKTIRRDLVFLARTGFPLVESTGPHGRKTWRLSSPSSTSTLTFTLTEITSLYLGRELMLPLSGTDFGLGANSAFRKIRSTLGDQAMVFLAKVASLIYSTGSATCDYSNHAEILDRLMIACEDSKVLHVTYQSQRATEPVTLEVDPYGIVLHRGALYLVAFSREHSEVRHYKLNRISDVTIQVKRSFVKPPTDFNLKSHLTNSFGIIRGDGVARRVRIHFSREVARFLREKTWHPSQVLTDQTDGSLIAEFALDDLREVTSWILSFGHKARALAPDELVHNVVEELRRAALQYSEPPQGIHSPTKRRAR